MRKRVVFSLFCILTLNVYASVAKDDYETLKKSVVSKYEKQMPKQWGEKVTDVKTQFNTKEKVIRKSFLMFDVYGFSNSLSSDSLGL